MNLQELQYNFTVSSLTLPAPSRCLSMFPCLVFITHVIISSICKFSTLLAKNCVDSTKHGKFPVSLL